MELKKSKSSQIPSHVNDSVNAVSTTNDDIDQSISNNETSSQNTTTLSYDKDQTVKRRSGKTK